MQAIRPSMNALPGRADRSRLVIIFHRLHHHSSSFAFDASEFLVQLVYYKSVAGAANGLHRVNCREGAQYVRQAVVPSEHSRGPRDPLDHLPAAHRRWGRAPRCPSPPSCRSAKPFPAKALPRAQAAGSIRNDNTLRRRQTARPGQQPLPVLPYECLQYVSDARAALLENRPIHLSGMGR